MLKGPSKKRDGELKKKINFKGGSKDFFLWETLNLRGGLGPLRRPWIQVPLKSNRLNNLQILDTFVDKVDMEQKIFDSWL